MPTKAINGCLVPFLGMPLVNDMGSEELPTEIKILVGPGIIADFDDLGDAR